jgi:drug/metabolite transporter (DMT)-like permease
MTSSLFIMIGSYINSKFNRIQLFGPFPKEIWISLIKRAIFGYFAIISALISIYLMPAEMAGCIMVSIGIMTALMAYSFDYEDLSVTEVVAILASFAGCIIINNPSVSVGSEIKNYAWGCSAAALYTVFGAMNLLQIRDLAQ